jgi:di/tricarboxylate transporter
MTIDIAITLSIIAAAVFLFATEKLRVDIIALLVLLTLTIIGLITPDQAFAGFSNPAVITVWAVYIVSGGLFRTGVADILGQRIIKIAGNSEPRLIMIIMLTCGLMSAFMNNIGATAVLLPAVVGISRKANVPLSRLLIPLSFSSLMGGNMTIIGTPPNIIASAILEDRGLPTFGFFDFAPTGIIIFAAGILYMVLIGRHLLPRRDTAEDWQATRMRDYVTEVRVSPGSTLAGLTLGESRLGADFDLNVRAIVRDGRSNASLFRFTRIHEGDLLVVEGAVDNLIEARDTLGLEIESEKKFELGTISPNDVVIIEATLAPRSGMVGRSLREVRFRDHFGFTALAIWRQGGVITQRLRDVRLKFGDALLLQGPKDRVADLQREDDFLVLEPVKPELRRRKKAPFAVGIMLLVIAMVLFTDVHVSVAMVIGSVLMVLSQCLTMEEAYQSIEWRSVFLIAGMLPLGTAMETTGTARFLADGIVNLVGGLGPMAVLIGIYILASLITEPMSNAAATVLIVPIAIDTALGIGANPQTFVLATVIGASTSFLTPVGHQANVLVYGPGGYRFTDYTRVGGLLNIVLLIVAAISLPLIWPLFS